MRLGWELLRRGEAPESELKDSLFDLLTLRALSTSSMSELLLHFLFFLSVLDSIAFLRERLRPGRLKALLDDIRRL